MQLKSAIVIFLLSLMMTTWGHNLVPHQHQEAMPMSSLERGKSEHRHHHHHHHHEGALSWLEWLKHWLGDFSHADFGEKHLEYYYIKNPFHGSKAAPFAKALLPEFYSFEPDILLQCSQRPVAPAARAPDPPGIDAPFNRGPPTFFLPS